jgi:hypothetical protein
MKTEKKEIEIIYPKRDWLDDCIDYVKKVQKSWDEKLGNYIDRAEKRKKEKM